MTSSKQMEKMTVDEIYSNPCGFCWSCKWEKQPQCYPNSHKQCSVCAVILSVIDKTREEATNGGGNE